MHSYFSRYQVVGDTPWHLQLMENFMVGDGIRLRSLNGLILRSSIEVELPICVMSYLLAFLLIIYFISASL